MAQRNFRAEFEAAFPEGTFTHQFLKDNEDRLPDGFLLLPNATSIRWDVALPDGTIIDVIQGQTNRRQWHVKNHRYNWDTGERYLPGSNQGGGTTSSSSSGSEGEASSNGYIDNDGIARNEDGSLDVEGQCAIRGGQPFSSPEGYHRCDAPITGYAKARTDPFSLEMTDLISAGQKQALAAAEKEKAQLRSGGRRSTILAGFGIGTPANRRTTILGSDKGKLVPRGPDIDLGPGNPRSDGTIAGSVARDTTLLGGPSASAGGAGTVPGQLQKPGETFIGPKPREAGGGASLEANRNRGTGQQFVNPPSANGPRPREAGGGASAEANRNRGRTKTLLDTRPTAQDELTPKQRRAKAA